MTGFRAALAGCILGLASLLSPGVANSMPGVPAIAAAHHSDMVRAQVVCDSRGCFGFGPRQSYTPPSYRPPDYRGAPYYRPRATVTPRMIYRPPAANPPPAYRSPAGGGSRHVQWCLNRYRSYNPATNRYMTFGGNETACISPYSKR